jgi:ribosomal-protein-alanine N-acetyltransferase
LAVKVKRLSASSFDTDRLIVKEWRALIASDKDMAEVVITILTPRVTRSLPEGWQGEYTADRASRWIAERDQEGATLLVLDGSSRAPIGLMILFESERGKSGRCVRIGYLLAESAWGQGFASELLEGFVDWCGTANISSVIGGVARENVASRRILEKNGFDILPDTQNQHELIYELRLD